MQNGRNMHEGGIRAEATEYHLRPPASKEEGLLSKPVLCAAQPEWLAGRLRNHDDGEHVW